MKQRNDLFLVAGILLLGVIILSISFFSKKADKKAEVYYQNNLVRIINFKVDEQIEIEGKLGKIVIEVKGEKLRVIEETSNRNICSRKGFIERVGEVIVCLPNEVFIKITGISSNEIFL